MPDDRYAAIAREWLKSRKKEDDEHGGLMPRRMYPPDTLAESLAALLARVVDEEREQCLEAAYTEQREALTAMDTEKEATNNYACFAAARRIAAAMSAGKEEA